MRTGRTKSVLCAVGSAALGMGLLVVTPVSASAAESERSYTCSGASFMSPGVLSGTHGSVRVSGFCVVNAGPALVKGDLTVLDGAVLVSAFGLNDTTGTGHSSLTVRGDIRVRKGATAILGCFPTSFPCIDDPGGQFNSTVPPTFSSPVVVKGDLVATNPLAVIVHDGTIGGDVTERGGGGGFNCNPAGIFQRFGSPVYSDYEDSSIRGDLRISGLNSCWLGAARVHIGGDASFVNDQLADLDAIEILSNTIKGDLVCLHNSFVWDSADSFLNPPGVLWPRAQEPNTVRGDRVGQCNVLQNPATEFASPGPLPF
jgi:hypothetical protein